jgi:hypothetical protein
MSQQLDQREPTQAPSVQSSRLSIPREVGIWLLFVLAVVAMQIWGGAFASETARRSDESAHVLNGVVFRDYLLRGIGSNPLTFVLKFYLHYPAVAPAIWPPIYHFALGFWMLLAGSSVGAAVVFQAMIGGGCIYAMFQVGKRGLGTALALIVCALLLSSGMFWRLLCNIMIDPALVGGALLFALAYPRFAADPCRRNMILLGLAGGLWSVLKVNGMAVAPALLFAWFLTPRPRPPWKITAGAGIIAVGIGLPFNVLASIVFAMHKPDVEPGLSAMLRRLGGYGYVLLREEGWLLLALSFAGLIWTLVRRFTNREVETVDMGLIGVLFGVIIFHVWMPAGFGDRYALPAMPVVFYFCARFCLNLVQLWRPTPLAPRLAAVLLLAACAVYAGTHWRPYFFGPTGLRDAASWIRSQPHTPPLRVLILGKEQSETAFVVEMATADPTRGEFVMRGTKLISDSSWVGGGYKLLIGTPELLADKIEAIGFQYVIFDRNALKDPYNEHLLADRMFSALPDRFRPVWRTKPRAEGPTHDVVVYQVAHPAQPPTERIRYNLSRSIGGEVTESGPAQ